VGPCSQPACRSGPGEHFGKLLGHARSIGVMHNSDDMLQQRIDGRSLHGPGRIDQSWQRFRSTGRMRWRERRRETGEEELDYLMGSISCRSRMTNTSQGGQVTTTSER
jgi:hypothetical protein